MGVEAKDLRESFSSTTLGSESREAQQAQLRKTLAVPKGVPMYTLSPSPSGDLPRLAEAPVRPEIPKPRASREGWIGG